MIGGAGIAAALATGQADLPSTTATAALVVVIFFILGYALYSCAFAAAGAIVSRLGGYLASISAIDKPTSTLAEVLTYLSARGADDRARAGRPGGDRGP